DRRLCPSARSRRAARLLHQRAAVPAGAGGDGAPRGPRHLSRHPAARFRAQSADPPLLRDPAAWADITGNSFTDRYASGRVDQAMFRSMKTRKIILTKPRGGALVD